MTKTPEYQAWIDMRRRCYASNRREFKNYGGRGIKVCKRWRFSFEQFFADMGLMPGKRYTVERKNVNGNYTPSNCVWLPFIAQSNNRRMVKMRRRVWRRVAAFYAAGHTVVETAARFGVCKETARLTIMKGGGKIRHRSWRKPR